MGLKKYFVLIFFGFYATIRHYQFYGMFENPHRYSSPECLALLPIRLYFTAGQHCCLEIVDDEIH
jgi:hypothetical protein